MKESNLRVNFDMRSRRESKSKLIWGRESARFVVVEGGGRGEGRVVVEREGSKEDILDCWWCLRWLLWGVCNVVMAGVARGVGVVMRMVGVEEGGQVCDRRFVYRLSVGLPAARVLYVRQDCPHMSLGAVAVSGCVGDFAPLKTYYLFLGSGVLPLKARIA